MSDFLRGHKIESLNNEWVYSDTKLSTVNTFKDRPCGNCGKFTTEKGHDNCIADLPVVRNACCGHGIEKDAYVQFDYGMYIKGVKLLTIKGAEALKMINILKEIKAKNNE